MGARTKNDRYLHDARAVSDELGEERRLKRISLGGKRSQVTLRQHSDTNASIAGRAVVQAGQTSSQPHQDCSNQTDQAAPKGERWPARSRRETRSDDQIETIL